MDLVIRIELVRGMGDHLWMVVGGAIGYVEGEGIDMGMVNGVG